MTLTVYSLLLILAAVSVGVHVAGKLPLWPAVALVVFALLTRVL